ncbi:MAG: TlpA disulfide reductase family protein [Telluria sp.]|nr:TlpA disulfide reductase family protein [Telluria sp.]
MIAHDSSGMKANTFAALLVAAALGSPLHAQPAAAPAVAGKTLDGKPFQLSSLKGKVVLVMFWSTGCAVCRDKMAELRQNYEGWSGKPFELVLVSTDRKRQDVEDYERIISRTVPVRQRFVQLWAGEPGYRDNLGTPAQLPATYVIDKAGQVVGRYQGRVPAQAWDRIADLL